MEEDNGGWVATPSHDVPSNFSAAVALVVVVVVVVVDYDRR